MSKPPAPDMFVHIAGIALRNPVIAASGTFGYGVEFDEILSLDKIGGFVVKGLSPEPMAGNATPRIIQTPSGMMNAIGLQNIGVGAFVRETLPQIRSLRGVKGGTAVIANVFGFQTADYLAVIRELNAADGVSAYELNVSCPNTQHGGMVFGMDPGLLYELVYKCKLASTRPIIVKLSPNVTSIAQMARSAVDAGADAISLVNTFLSLSIDALTRKPRIANVTGGLSGPAIKPIALRLVYEAARAVTVPIIGMGGIATAEDAVEFMLAGASAVQVGTASYADPRATENIANGLTNWCRENNIAKVTDLIGKFQP
jgi:dihydroorotate dehydrogenase (NAD+) catalytic subunit